MWKVSAIDKFVAWHPQVYCQCLDVQSRTSLRRVLPGLVTGDTKPVATILQGSSDPPGVEPAYCSTIVGSSKYPCTVLFYC